MLRKVPLIVILGSTGTGKTKLSLELAERFGGEIISADSMQVYENLDIVTAKATKNEQARARHHLLDVASPSDPYTVVHFRNAALPIIDKLLGQSKFPIVVGGTNYYIESLLWDVLVNNSSVIRHDHSNPALLQRVESGSTSVNMAPENMKYWSYVDMSMMPSEVLYNHLKIIDPESANRLHPNNKRKIMRAIEVYQQTGQTLSDKLKEQRSQPGGNRLGGPLRYPHTILFWLRCKQDVLNARLDKRVDGMLEEGLLREVRSFYDLHKESICDSKTDNPYTKGILQTIGFKEFIPYLEQFDALNDEKIELYLQENGYQLPTEACENPPGLDILSQCLNELKLVTRRYSKKQIKWIQNRFLSSKDRQVPDLYELDTSDISLWKEAVYRPAEDVVQSYLDGKESELKPLPKLVHPGAGLNEETSHFCALCERHFVGEYQWNIHMKSNKHKRRQESARRKAKQALETQSVDEK